MEVHLPRPIAGKHHVVVYGRIEALHAADAEAVAGELLLFRGVRGGEFDAFQNEDLAGGEGHIEPDPALFREFRSSGDIEGDLFAEDLHMALRSLHLQGKHAVLLSVEVGQFFILPGEKVLSVQNEVENMLLIPDELEFMTLFGGDVPAEDHHEPHAEFRDEIGEMEVQIQFEIPQEGGGQIMVVAVHEDVIEAVLQNTAVVVGIDGDLFHVDPVRVIFFVVLRKVFQKMKRHFSIPFC